MMGREGGREVSLGKGRRELREREKEGRGGMGEQGRRTELNAAITMQMIGLPFTERERERVGTKKMRERGVGERENKIKENW